MIALNQPFQLLTETECADFISRARTLEMVKGQTYTNQTHVRTNDIIWFSFTEDERNRFWELVKDYWDQVHWYEHPVQISIYKPGQYYDWHTDDKPNRRRTSTSASGKGYVSIHNSPAPASNGKRNNVK